MKEYQGSLKASQGKKIAIVVARFNEAITKKLLMAALETFEKCNIDKENITITWVPGAFEIPLVAKKLAFSQQYHAILTLGCVIRGETGHYDFIAGETAAGISKVALESGIPTIFGVLTTESLEQAIARSGTTEKNKGIETALATVEMISLTEELALDHIELVKN